MASQEELNRQNEINDALERRVSLERELVDILSRRVGIDSQNVIAQQDIGNTLAEQLKNLKGHTQEKSSIRNITAKLNNLSREAYSIGVETLGNEKERNKVLKQISEAESNIRVLNLQKEEFAKKALNATEEERRLYQAIVSSLEDQISESTDLNKQLKQTVELSEKISNNFGVKTFGALSDITKSIPGLSRFSEPFQKAGEASRSMAANIEIAAKSGGKGLTAEKIKQLGLENQVGKLTGSAAANKLKGMSGFSKGLAAAQAGFKALGPMISKALGPIGLITQFVQGLLEADKETTELQKSMALTKGEAVGFRMELMNAAGATGDINITSSKLLKTFGELNKQFGFITNFASSTLVTMTKLTGVVGVSSQSAGNLAAASELSGKSFESNYKDVLGTSYELQRQSGVQMDLRDILEQTGKVTGTVRANLGANPSLMAAAVTQAKLFGASLEQVAAAGKSMLDFESSITAELEAELLLGKDLNLERARAAALAGDQVTLAQELQKQAGTFSDFTKMNVIQQEALAKSMGMTSDQLADILFQQEIQGKTAKELRALGKDELAERLEAQTLQDRLNASIEKMQNLFTDLASGLTPLLWVLGKALSIVGLIAGAIQDLISFVGMIFGGEDPGSSAFVGAAKSLFGMETTTMDDGVIPTGYGETIIKKGKDTIALNNNDQMAIVAGTNLAQNSSANTQNSSANEGILTESKRMNMLLERIASQPPSFKIDGDEFYTSTSKYRFEIQ